MDAPMALKDLKQWHLWRLESDRKIPYQVDGISKARSNDPRTWSSYEDAVDSMGPHYNLAFTLGTDRTVTGLDFDDCFDESGRMYPWASEIYAAIKDYAYIEFSPSGTGFKATMFGRKPDWAACQKSFGEQGALEVYDNNRFWAFTGDPVDPDRPYGTYFGTICCDIVSAVCEKHLKPAPVKIEAPVPQVGRKVADSQFTDVQTRDYRVEQYLAQIPTPMRGSRNNSMFKLAGNLRGFGLNIEQILMYVSEFNQKSPDPLPQGEINQVCVSAMKSNRDTSKGQNREFTRDEPEVLDLSDMPVLQVESEINDIEEGDTIYRPGTAEDQLPMSLMDDGGFIGDFTKMLIEAQMVVQPELAFAAALHASAVCLSRHVIDDSQWRTTPNLYSVSLAESGTGKDVVRRALDRLLEETDNDHLVGPEVIDSGAGLAMALVKQPSMSMLLDECGTLFKNLGSDRCPAHLKKAGDVLKSAYTSASKKKVRLRQLANSDQGQNDPVEYPHLNIMGTATPGQVLGSISDNQIEDGLMGRFLIFFGCDEPEVRDDPAYVNVTRKMVAWASQWRSQIPTNTAVPGDLMDDLNAGRDPMKIVNRTAEAKLRLAKHYSQIMQRNVGKAARNASPAERVVWNRASEKTAKLALLFACSRCMNGRPEITIDDANRAIAISNHMTRRVIKAYEHRIQSEYQKQRDEMLAMINGMVSPAQLNRLAKKFPPQLRDTILRDLMASKEVMMVVHGKRNYYSRGTI